MSAEPRIARAIPRYAVGAPTAPVQAGAAYKNTYAAAAGVGGRLCASISGYAHINVQTIKRPVHKYLCGHLQTGFYFISCIPAIYTFLNVRMLTRGFHYFNKANTVF